MKKIFLILIVGMLLAGCSIGQEASGNNVELRYGLWDKNQAPVVEELIKQFNEEHPNITVKVELTPYQQYFQKLETAATGGAMPDILWMNGPNITKYAKGNVLLPLDDFIQNDNYSLENYPESLKHLYNVDGKQYGIPKDYDTTGLWYNQKLFDEAGIEYPDESWTWETLKEAARKLTDQANSVYGFSALMANQGGYYDFIWQNGGYVIGDDQKSVGFQEQEAIEALKFNISFIEEGLSPTAEQMSETSPSDLFLSGKIAMIFDGPWMVPKYKDNKDLNVAVLPKGKQRAVSIHGLGNVISAKTKHKEAAWEFLKFLGSKEAAETFAKTGTVIPAFNGTQDAWLESVEHLNLQAYIDGAEYSNPLPSLENTSVLWELEKQILKNAWSGEATVEEAVKELTEKANEALNKN